MKKLIVLIPFVAMLLGIVAVPYLVKPAAAPTLKQFYTCKGVDPSGEAYTVSMETRVYEGKTQWRQSRADGSVILGGEGFYSGDRFIGVAWFNDAHPAIVEYQIVGKTLKGLWKPVGDEKVYTESCIEAAAPPTQPAPAVETPDAKPGRTLQL